MGQAQINVRTRACSRTSIARTKQAALTHNVRGKELTKKVVVAASTYQNHLPSWPCYYTSWVERTDPRRWWSSPLPPTDISSHYAESGGTSLSQKFRWWTYVTLKLTNESIAGGKVVSRKFGQMWPICTKPVACRQSSFSATGRNASLLPILVLLHL